MSHSTTWLITDMFSLIMGYRAKQHAKTLLTWSCILTHYDPSKPLVVTCNTLPYGIGVVQTYKLRDEEHLIAYASCSLAPAEENCSQNDKEALAIIFGVRHFHQYLYGCLFTAKSDHKPLQHLFGKGRGIPARSSAWVQRSALILSTYDYKVQYISGKDANDDVFSHLPHPMQPREVSKP